MSRVLDELGRHIVHLHHVVDQSSGSCALRHAAQRNVIEARLCEGKSAMRLDRAHADRPVAAGSREDDADGIFALAFGQRGEE